MSKGPKKKVQVWLVHEGVAGEHQFLLLKTRPGRGEFWQPVTGSVEKGEELVDAALREANEETGLGLPGPALPLDYEFAFLSRGHEVTETAFYLIVSCPKTPEVTLDPHEHTEYEWIKDPKQVLKRLQFETNADVFRILLKKLGK